jgi:hypothetical protein
MSIVRRRRRNDLIVGATAGIVSINGQTEAAQFLTPGNAIDIGSVGGVHTIGVADQSITIQQIAPLEIEDSVIANHGIGVGKLNSGGGAGGEKIMIGDGSQGFDLLPQTLGVLQGSPEHQSSGTNNLYFSFSSLAPAVNVGNIDDRVTVIPFDCEISELVVFIKSNSKTTQSIYTLMKNGDNATAILVGVNGGSNGAHFESTPVTVCFEAGDTVNLRQETFDGANIILQSFALRLISRNTGSCP